MKLVEFQVTVVNVTNQAAIIYRNDHCATVPKLLLGAQLHILCNNYYDKCMLWKNTFIIAACCIMLNYAFS